MHQEESINELLKRYALNQCSQEDIEKVIVFFKSATNSDRMPSVEEVLNFLNEQHVLTNETSDLAFDRILKIAKEREGLYAKRTKRPLQKYAAIAAVFAIVLASAYFFWSNTQNHQNSTIPADAITLELEDGQIQILKEDDSKVLVDKNGHVLGQQQGNKISYENKGTSEELVYNTLKVPYGKRFEIRLSDGTTVHLNAGTSIRYPSQFIEGQDRVVYLSGEAFFDVSRDTLRPFIVNANELDVRVLGTQFNVSAYPEDENTDVVLVEGSVGMYKGTETFHTSSSTILQPGFMGSFQKTSGKIETQEVVTDIYTSWMNGHLVFRNMTFESILKKMERHYNVSIINNNSRMGQEIFNASYGDITIQKVLQDLKLTYGLDYTINGANIIINQNQQSMKQ